MVHARRTITLATHINTAAASRTPSGQSNPQGLACPRAAHSQAILPLHYLKTTVAQSLSTNYSASLTRRTSRHAMALIGGLFEKTRTKQPISSIKFYSSI